jgi:hypothetical protein
VAEKGKWKRRSIPFEADDEEDRPPSSYPPRSTTTMYLTRSEYDRGVNTFSPEGRLFQVEYAIEAIKLGSTAVGLQTKSGSILAVEKRLTSPLLEPSSVEKIAEIDVHIGAAMSGLVADARTLVDHARVEAQNHRFTYDEAIGVEALTQGELLMVVRCICLFICWAIGWRAELAGTRG